MIAELKK